MDRFARLARDSRRPGCIVALGRSGAVSRGRRPDRLLGIRLTPRTWAGGGPGRAIRTASGHGGAHLAVGGEHRSGRAADLGSGSWSSGRRRVQPTRSRSIGGWGTLTPRYRNPARGHENARSSCRGAGVLVHALGPATSPTRSVLLGAPPRPRLHPRRSRPPAVARRAGATRSSRRPRCPRRPPSRRTLPESEAPRVPSHRCG